MSDRIYFVKRVNWFSYEVWFRRADGGADLGSGATEWPVSFVRYWRWITAARHAQDCQSAYNAGEWQAIVGSYEIQEIACPPAAVAGDFDPKVRGLPFYFWRDKDGAIRVWPNSDEAMRLWCMPEPKASMLGGLGAARG